MTVWLPIPGFEGLYDVSDGGLIRRMLSNTSTKAGRILKPELIGGYQRITLFKGGKRFRIFVHIIVCRTFHGKKPSNHEVNHKNKKRTVNRADNLEWMTKQENGIHATGKRYIVVNPNGKSWVILGLKKFCKSKGLDASAMISVAKGVYAQHKQWQCKYARERIQL